ncbi:Peptidase M50 [Candidatus Sulfopaludibacter sp. SbA3]|nr:Peptidase M50 [Candidatus Sulfopaludibacter sp. SbA3]
MTTLCDCPDSGIGEWRFRLFGIPVRVTVWFWIAILLIGGEQRAGAEGIWIAVCFISILLHEFGHVCAFRLFRERAEVVLYGFGGLAIPRQGVYGSFPRLVVALAGPFAGFCLAGLTLLAASYSGALLRLGFVMVLPRLFVYPRVGGYSHWYILANDLLWVNFYWGLVNLLPIYPLDGGHAALAILEQVDPREGRRRALILSAALAGAVTMFGVLQHNYYLALMFAILAVSSLQLLDGLRGGMQQSYRSPRR